VLSLSYFAGLLLVSDCHIHPSGAGNVYAWWKLLQASASGVLWERTSLLHGISLFPSRCDLTQPRKNMLGYPPRLRLHGWLIACLVNNKTLMLWWL
jgi:hypothetical protein